MYEFRVEINGDWKTFKTLKKALEYIEKNWREKENPNIRGTFFCSLKLYSDRNVITEGGFQIDEKRNMPKMQTSQTLNQA